MRDVQGSYVYQNDVEAELLPYNRQFSGTQSSFGVADFSGELRRGAYSLTLFIDNAFDERADLYRYQECAILVCGRGPVGQRFRTDTVHDLHGHQPAPDHRPDLPPGVLTGDRPRRGPGWPPAWPFVVPATCIREPHAGGK